MTDKQGSLEDLDMGSAFQTAYNSILRQRGSVGLNQGKLNTFLKKMDYILERIENVSLKHKWFFYDLLRDIKPARSAWEDLTQSEKNFQIVRLLMRLLEQIELAANLADSKSQKAVVMVQFTESVTKNNKLIRVKLRELMQL